MKFLIPFLQTIVIFLFSWGVSANSLPIGISLNQSSAGAQQSIEFKNGIEAYFKAANASGRFGKYKLKLIAMDDNDKKERTLSNVRRLINSKKVLALLSNHQGETQKELTELSIKTKTLLLSSSSTHVEVPNYAQKYIGYLSVDTKQHIDNAMPVLSQSKEIYLLLDSQTNQAIYGQHLSTKVSPGTLVAPIGIDNLEHSGIADRPDTLFIIGESFIFSSVALKRLSNAGFKQAKFLVLPDAGATLVSQAIANDPDFDGYTQLNFLNSVPLHLKHLSMVDRFNSDLSAYNSRASKSHQAFKGYLLAHVLSEGIYKAVKDIKAESIKDLVTLPFQVLDKVVGWVAHAGDSINKDIMVESVNRVNNVDLGLNQKLNFGKSRVIIDHSWITQTNKSSSFSQVIALPPEK